MKKTYYKPKEKKVKEKAVKEVEVKAPAVAPEIEVVKAPDIQIQLSPLSPADICNQLVITGVHRNFLEKKYFSKSYLLETWKEILIKERMDY